ncbi:uncharacterized protein DEA37_0004006 [Paragonimus westermani]|uniref:C2H2-type domain-containing protein n=1 Tax=Paragonimus westermani TaxID=34504 RepID=A0A5J4NFA6_9TREM|nr:uncharacterized protein DEA37_0004006 [Paragonimus westermani]
MLDADSVFERLLREATNLVPKMSTPKLTNALKIISTLYQKITETAASRLQPETGNAHIGDPSVTIHSQFSMDSAFADNLLPDLNSLPSCESSKEPCGNTPVQQSRASSLLPQVNHIPSSVKETTTLVPSSDSLCSSVGYSTNSVLPSMPTITVVSSSQDLGSCAGTILLPIMSSVLTPAPPLYHTNPVVTSASNSAHLSVGGDALFSEATTTSALMNVDPNGFLNTKSSVAVSCNGQKPMDIIMTESDRSGQLAIPEESLDMKPEPSECLTQVTTRSLDTITDPALLVANAVELSSLAFPHLSSLSSFTSPSTVSTPISTTATSRSQLTASSTTSLVVVDAMSPSSTEIASSSLKASHPGAGPYRCRDCDKEFRILRYLEKHRRIHTGEKPYQCCYCGRQFNDWPNMNRHKRIHTGERPYRCSVCAKTFSQPAVYNEHVKRHTGERPYICMVCAKGFPRAARLAVHMRVHTGERPYPCTACDRRFSQPHHLAAHLRVHSGDRPYSCPKCDVSFACISNLRRHRKQVHPTSPVPSDELEMAGDSILSLNEKKPSLQRLSSAGSSNDPANSHTGVSLESSLIAASSSLTADHPVALAAAMSGTLLTATGALVPANLLPSSSISGLILTSGPSGTFLAAPAQFADQQSQLQPALIAHTGLVDGSGLLSGSSGPGASLTLTPHAGALTSATASDNFLKSVSSSTVSLMLPTVLTATANAETLRQTAVTFLTPTGELDRSCAALAAAAAGGHEGGLVLNQANGETVYLEPLDPRITFEHGHPFTLTTIPTSQNPGTATILGPSHSGTHLLGHPVQLQTGSHTTHIAFATTNLSSHPSQLLASNPTMFSTTNSLPAQTAVYTGQNPTTIIFPSHVTLPSTTSAVPTSLNTAAHQARQPSVLSANSTQGPTSVQFFHYPRPASGSAITTAASPNRPASTPTQPQTTMFVPIISSSLSANSNVSSSNCDSMCAMDTAMSSPNWPAGGFVTLTGTTHLASPVLSGSHEEAHVETSSFVSPRPSSVLSNASSSLGAITVTTVSETNL